MMISDNEPNGQTVICLVRHGETDWNVAGRLQGREDIPLNAHGRAQARLTGRRLAADEWDLLVSSPLRRAWETAEIIGEAIGIRQIVPEPALVERDYGRASGLTNAEVRAAFADDAIPGRESRDEVRSRSMAALGAILAANPGKRIVIVAHGGVIRAIVHALSDGDHASIASPYGNACLCHLTHDGDRWQIVAANVVDHLEPLARPAR
jgi:uncharacterized phosphatase